jgi:hypothetical protein
MRVPSLLTPLLLALPLAALAEVPDTCAILKPDEINTIAQNQVTRVEPRKTGNPSQCAFLDVRRGAVLVLTIREVQYAVKDEMFYERENLEKIYRSKSKPIDTIGEGGFWLNANKQLVFRKAKFIVWVVFSTPKNQNEVDTGAMARLVESRLQGT